MSSSIYIMPEKQISISEFKKWARNNKIYYAKHCTIAGTFYHGTTEVSFSQWKGKTEINVSTFWMGDLGDVTYIGKKILKRYGGTYQADPELAEWMDK